MDTLYCYRKDCSLYNKQNNTCVLGNTRFISRVKHDITFNTRNISGISAHPCIILYLILTMPFSFGRSDGQHCHLGLIDFGCAIDVELFPSGTRFSVDKNTESFECIEMKTQRPWTTQVCLCRNGHNNQCDINI